MRENLFQRTKLKQNDANSFHRINQTGESPRFYFNTTGSLEKIKEA